jgi:hypothetical protein
MEIIEDVSLNRTILQMRYPASERLDIIRQVEQSHLPAVAALSWRSMAPGRQIPMGVPIAL